MAAALTKEVYDRGEIVKELFDRKWEIPPCKLYLFKETAEEVKDLAHALGQEDSEDYKLVFAFSCIDLVGTPFYETYRKVRDLFEAEYAEPGDELQHWRSKAPATWPSTYLKWKSTLAKKCYQFVRIAKKDSKDPKANLEKKARQLVAFATRIKPIHLMLWNILTNRIPNQRPKDHQLV